MNKGMRVTNKFRVPGSIVSLTVCGEFPVFEFLLRVTPTIFVWLAFIYNTVNLF